MSRFDMSELEWSFIKPILPDKVRGVTRVDDRRVINGIFYKLRTGVPWRDLPERYGPYTTVYNRFNRWTKAGVWDRLMEHRCGFIIQPRRLKKLSISVHGTIKGRFNNKNPCCCE